MKIIYAMAYIRSLYKTLKHIALRCEVTLLGKKSFIKLYLILLLISIGRN